MNDRPIPRRPWATWWELPTTNKEDLGIADKLKPDEKWPKPDVVDKLLYENVDKTNILEKIKVE
ncbi:MAG: hypothetical protein ACREXX_04335 [Gammaproteobacteria bacterium]